MGGLPGDHDSRDCVRALVSEFGWRWVESGPRSHPAGYLLCSHSSRDGCRINVASTGHNTARKIWQKARRCSHGNAPNRRQW